MNIDIILQNLLLEASLSKKDSEILILIKALSATDKVEFKKANGARAVYAAMMDGNKRRQTVESAIKKIKANKKLDIVEVAPARSTKSFAFRFKSDTDAVIYEVQTKPDNKRTGGDPNELMAAAACFIPSLKNSLPETTEDLDVFIERILEIIPQRVKDFDSSHIKLMDSDYDNCCQAISAALAIQEFCGGVPDMAYITGQKWNADIAKFKRNAYGMRDFNSSDIVFKKGKAFYGVSLKKKRLETETDPTLLNKSFTSLFDVSNSLHNEIISKLEEKKETFYISVINSAIKDKVVKPFKFDPKKWGKYIGTIPNEYVNAKLKTENSFFKDIYDIVVSHKNDLADYLINLILKMELKELLQHNFNFALVTGIGRYLSTQGPIIAKGEIKDITTVVEKMDKLFATGAIDMITSPGKKQGFEADGGSAALYFTIKIKDLHMLDIVLRYKGTFSSQPSFLATMTTDFKKYLSSK